MSNFGAHVHIKVFRYFLLLVWHLIWILFNVCFSKCDFYMFSMYFSSWDNIFDLTFSCIRKIKIDIEYFSTYNFYFEIEETWSHLVANTLVFVNNTCTLINLSEKHGVKMIACFVHVCSMYSWSSIINQWWETILR